MKFFRHKKTGQITPTNNAHLIAQLSKDDSYEAVDGTAKARGVKHMAPVIASAVAPDPTPAPTGKEGK